MKEVCARIASQGNECLAINLALILLSVEALFLIQRLAFIIATVLFACVPAFANADAPSGTISGTVRTGSGQPVDGAHVTASGPAQASATTDASGAFTLQLREGVYRIVVTKGGYLPAEFSDLTVLAGSSIPLQVSLSQADLGSLRTIANVTTSRGSSINAGAASTSFLPQAAITNFANPQINDVLAHIPDLTIQHMGSQPDTSIVLGGAQPYETQVLIDGHPLSMGQFGVWLSEYYSSFLLAGVETQIGPGNTTPFANTAVGGTTNLLTPGFTRTPTYEYVMGTDNFNSQYSHLLLSGARGKLQYVFGVGYGSNNGPYFKGNHCVVTPDNTANDNQPGAVGIVQFCGDSSGSLFTKGEILKLRYNFSNSTSFEAGFIGSQGGYLPQGTSYGQYLGVMTIVPCLPSQPLFCNNPSNSSLIGKNIDAYAWYPGSNVYSNQPIFTGQLRTSIGNNTLLIRPYAGNIEHIIDGLDEQAYPLAFSPPGTVPSADGNTNPFEVACNNDNFLGQTVNGFTGAPTTVVNGQEECFQTVFSEFEKDKLYGTTLSFLHPMGDSLLDFTYDYHGDNTFAYYNTPDMIATPNTTERYTTFSLTGDLRVVRHLTAKVGLYDTTWKIAGLQPVPNSTPDPTTGALPLEGLTRTTSRLDPHIALVFQPATNVSYRFAYGTSETYPFSGQVSGLAENTPPSATFPNGFITQKNPYLRPETSSELSLGGDVRLRNKAILGLDLQDTVIHDVFETLSIPNAFPTGQALVQPFNAARLHAQIATIRYGYSPLVGFGYNAALAFEKSVVSGIPDSFYAAGPGLPANGQQICGFGNATPGTTTCIPYMKGYGQLTYAFSNGTYAALGGDFEGKNNTYFQPPFMLFDLTLRRPVTKNLDLQVAVQNLLNTNNFYNLPMPNSGVSVTAGAGGGQLTSLPSTLVPAPPRTLRLQIGWHSGP